MIKVARVKRADGRVCFIDGTGSPIGQQTWADACNFSRSCLGRGLVLFLGLLFIRLGVSVRVRVLVGVKDEQRAKARLGVRVKVKV